MCQKEGGSGGEVRRSVPECAGAVSFNQSKAAGGGERYVMVVLKRTLVLTDCSSRHALRWFDATSLAWVAQVPLIMHRI